MYKLPQSYGVIVLLNAFLYDQVLPKRLIVTASLSFHNNKKQKRIKNKRQQKQECFILYIYTTQSQSERYTSDIDHIDNRFASTSS